MNAHTPVIPLHLQPMGFIEAFTHFGAPLVEILRNTGIDEGALANRNARISYAQQRRLIANGLALCRRPGLGLLVGKRFDWSYYGTVGGVIHCSPSLRAAGEAVLRYLMILQPYYSQRARTPTSYLEANGMLVHPLDCFPAGECDPTEVQFEFDFRLAITLRLWEACGNKTVRDPAVHVRLHFAEPTHAELYRSLPCETLQFGCKQSSVAAHLDFVNQPFRLLRKPLFDRIVEQCDEEIRRANFTISHEAKVRWYLHANFSRQVSLEQAAQQLGVTPRTLTRRLAEEGTSFRQLVYDVRMELASHHLRNSRLTVDKIAELIGFSNASSLHRAIRKWPGPKTRTQLPRSGAGAGAILKSVATIASGLPFLQWLATSY